MLNVTIGMIPTKVVTARIGDNMKSTIKVAIINTEDLINIDTFVLKLSCTTVVSEFSLDTTKICQFKKSKIHTKVSCAVLFEKLNVFVNNTIVEISS